MAAKDDMYDSVVKKDFSIFLDEECDRCNYNSSKEIDPFVQKYFLNKYSNQTFEKKLFKYFGVKPQCHVCSHTFEDIDYLGQIYSDLLEHIPMFMNSVNYDLDYKENSEYKKFMFVDRYMLDENSWKSILRELQEDTTEYQSKKEVLYFRGSDSSINETYFNQDLDIKFTKWGFSEQLTCDLFEKNIENILP